MAMEISYTNGTKEEKFFQDRESFRWFLGMNAYDTVKINGYRRIIK